MHMRAYCCWFFSSIVLKEFIWHCGCALPVDPYIYFCINMAAFDLAVFHLISHCIFGESKTI